MPHTIYFSKMGKKIIISETALKKVIAKEILEESDLTKSDVASIVKDTIKNDSQLKKEMEKQVKALVASSVNTLFRTLWMRRSFYEDEIKKG